MNAFTGSPKLSDLVQEAISVLHDEKPMPSLAAIKAAQLEAAKVSDLDAIALWSRLRWRWCVQNGKADIKNCPGGVR